MTLTVPGLARPEMYSPAQKIQICVTSALDYVKAASKGEPCEHAAVFYANLVWQGRAAV